MNDAKGPQSGRRELPASFSGAGAFRRKGGMIMRATYRGLAILCLAALIPSVAHARGYGGSGGYVNTPFGPIPMNTMNMAGGNPFVASDMQQQMMMYQQQQQYMKMQQQYMKQMEQMKKSGQNPNGTMQGSTTGGTTGTRSPTLTASSSKKKKKHTSTTSTTTKKASAAPAKSDKSKEKDTSKASATSGKPE
jgi:hypothetical protein